MNRHPGPFHSTKQRGLRPAWRGTLLLIQRKKMATRTDADQTKAADEAARTARTVADEAVPVGEQIKRDEQDHKNADTARAGVENLAKFRQWATEDALR